MHPRDETPPCTPDRRLGGRLVWYARLEKGVTPAANVLESIDRIPFFPHLSDDGASFSPIPLTLTLSITLSLSLYSSLYHFLSSLFRSLSLSLYPFIFFTSPRGHTHENRDHRSLYRRPLYYYHHQYYHSHYDRQVRLGYLYTCSLRVPLSCSGKRW